MDFDKTRIISSFFILRAYNKYYKTFRKDDYLMEQTLLNRNTLAERWDFDSPQSLINYENEGILIV